MEKAMLYIEAPKEKAIMAARRSVLDVLKSCKEKEVRLEALRTLRSICEVHTVITGCHFEEHTKKK
jgi:hypothetical protein